MGSPTIVLRINTGEDEAMDWTVHPHQISFQETLEVISRVVPDCTVGALEYEDEDGDRITVRSEEEMANMISFYLNMLVDFAAKGETLSPLTIYPRVGKPPEKRNIHGLKVQTKSGSNTPSYTPSPMDQEASIPSSSKQEEKDLGAILACGSIVAQDLHKLEILGTGNAGTVYKSFHRPTQTIMAVKDIPLDITPEVQKQIISELQILYKCNSPVIIGFYGAFFTENRISICTEFMDGGSLDLYGQIPEPVLGRMAVAVVQGLQYLWNLMIMHRDVKPSNILVNTQGQVKLCDFGVSVQLVSSIAKTYVGTNVYMAPERIKGEDYRIQSDVWSLGVSLFEMAIGRFPYESVHAQGKAIDLLKSIVDKVPPPLPTGAFSDAFVQFVSMCMQKLPVSRPTPELLLGHPFIHMYDDQNRAIVAQWVRHKLEEVQIRRTQHACSA